MAVLQKIRQKSGLLIAVIGISLFAFIIGGLLQGGLGSLSRNVGEVNGTSIPTQEFLSRVQNVQSQGQSSSQVYEQVWNAEVRTILFNDQFEKLGLQLGKDQIMSIIKTLPDFANNPQFLDQSGMFDQVKFNQFLAQMKKDGGQGWNAWLNYEKQIEIYAKELQYINLVKGAVYTTSLEAKRVYDNENAKVGFDYVGVLYSTINDDEVKISDADIETYIKAHKKQFKSQPTRSVEYIFVENAPSDKDREFLNNDLRKLNDYRVVFNAETNTNDTIPGFKNSKNPIEFVNLNSDVPYDSTFIALDQMPLEQKQAIENLAVGDIYGPYQNGEYVSLSKILQKKPVANDVTVSHILIAYKDADRAAPTVELTKEEAEKKAQDLLSKVKANPASFATFAEANTDDAGSKSTGGQYKNVKRGQMVAPFDAFIFSNPVGAIGLVETQFGYHVIKVDEVETKPSVQLATISKMLEPSNETQDEIHMKSTKVEEQIASKDLSTIATDLGLISHPEAVVTAFQDELPAVGNQREAIQWVFNKDTEVGSSKRFSTASGELIVKVTDVNDTDLMSAKQARPMVEPILMRDKKAEILKGKIKGSSIQEMAKSVNTEVKTMPEVTLANPIVGGIQEPKVVGTAFGIGKGNTSKVIEGAKGVYVVQTKNITAAPNLPNYRAFKSRVFTNNKNTVPQSVFNALYQNADIEDNRSKIFNR